METDGRGTGRGDGQEDVRWAAGDFSQDPGRWNPPTLGKGRDRGPRENPTLGQGGPAGLPLPLGQFSVQPQNHQASGRALTQSPLPALEFTASDSPSGK